MPQPAKPLEAVEHLGFLHATYHEAGINVVDTRTAAMRRTIPLSQRVAGTIMDMLKAGQREFPIVDIADPTGTLAVPTQLVPNSFNEVTTRNVLDDRPGRPHVSHEAHLYVVSRMPEGSVRFRTLGALTISTGVNFDKVDKISLSRPDAADVIVGTDNMGFTDNPEAVAFLAHTRNYLNAI